MAGTSLGDVIDQARRRSFVGRRSELRAFDDAQAGLSPRRVLFVHGPGGIGKTTLLLEMRARARAAGRTAVLLDGSEVDPSPDGSARRSRPPAPPGAAGPARGPAAGPCCWWTGTSSSVPSTAGCARSTCPSLPAEDVVVLAGREPPAAAWRTDPGWRQVVAVYPLGHLDDVDSADLLAAAGVAAAGPAAAAPAGPGPPAGPRAARRRGPGRHGPGQPRRRTRSDLRPARVAAA